MEDLRIRLEQLHADSFGWALCCSGRDPEAARDLLQDVYLKVLEGRARHAGGGSFRTWLFGVIRRTAQEERRRSWRRELRLARYWQRQKKQVVPLPPDVEPLVLALGALPRQQREVLHLVFYEELSIAEAAEVMGVSVGTARTHYHRAKEALRERLDPESTGQATDEMGSGRTADTSTLR